MKANELRIGNYFSDRNGNILRIDWWENINKACMKVTAAGVEVHPLTEHPEKAQPIELTSKWAKGFDFLNVNKGFENGVLRLEKAKDGYDCHYRIAINTFDSIYSEWYFVKRIKYVHELQNLYFAITGKELKLANPSKSEK